MAGVIATVRSTVRAERNGAQILDVRADPGGGTDVTPEQMLAPGDDSRPLPGDAVAGLPTQGEGRFAAVGYADPKTAGVSVEGEVRRYARDLDGATVATLHMKRSGEIEVRSVVGDCKVVLGPDGSITLDSLKAESSIVIGADGSIKVKNEQAVSAWSLNVDGSILGTNASGSYSLLPNGDFVVNGATIDTGGNLTTAAGVSVNGHTHAQGADSDGDSEEETEVPS